MLGSTAYEALVFGAGLNDDKKLFMYEWIVVGIGLMKIHQQCLQGNYCPCVIAIFLYALTMCISCAVISSLIATMSFGMVTLSSALSFGYIAQNSATYVVDKVCDRSFLGKTLNSFLDWRAGNTGGGITCQSLLDVEQMWNKTLRTVVFTVGKLGWGPCLFTANWLCKAQCGLTDFSSDYHGSVSTLPLMQHLPESSRSWFSKIGDVAWKGAPGGGRAGRRKTHKYKNIRFKTKRRKFKRRKNKHHKTKRHNIKSHNLKKYKTRRRRR